MNRTVGSSENRTEFRLDFGFEKTDPNRTKPTFYFCTILIIRFSDQFGFFSVRFDFGPGRFWSVVVRSTFGFANRVNRNEPIGTLLVTRLVSHTPDAIFTSKIYRIFPRCESLLTNAFFNHPKNLFALILILRIRSSRISRVFPIFNHRQNFESSA